MVFGIVLKFFRRERRNSLWLKAIAFVACLIFILQVMKAHIRIGEEVQSNTLKGTQIKTAHVTVPMLFPKKVTKALEYSLPLFKKFLVSGYRPPIDHHKILFEMNPKALCQRKLNFLIIVHSSLPNKIRRDTLRTTISKYSKLSKLPYKVIFVVGTTRNIKDMKPFIDENNKFQDLLMINSVDSYRNMTYKAVGWMKFVAKECAHTPDFIIKIDDDILLKMPQVVDMVRACLRTGSKNAICNQMSCLFKPDEPALRTGKNQVTLQEYPLKGYPLFCPGLMYMFPTKMLPQMLEATEKIPFLWLDDVYVTAFMMVYIDKKLNSLNDYIVHPLEQSLSPLLKKKMAAHFHSKDFRGGYIAMWNKMIVSYKKNS